MAIVLAMITGIAWIVLLIMWMTGAFERRGRNAAIFFGLFFLGLAFLFFLEVEVWLKAQGVY